MHIYIYVHTNILFLKVWLILIVLNFCALDSLVIPVVIPLFLSYSSFSLILSLYFFRSPSHSHSLH